MRIPLYIEMNGKNILVIGGGRTGTSRVKKFLSAGANVKVLSLEFSDELLKIRDKVELIKDDIYNLSLLEDLISSSDMVTVALPFKDLNKDVMRLAKKYKVLVNLANDADETEVVVPFETSIGGLRIAATSEGKSGLVVKEALKRIEEYLAKDSEIFNLLNLMHYLKNHMKKLEVPFEKRMELYYKVFNDDEFRKLIRDGKLEDARERLEKIVKVAMYEGSI